MYQAPRGMTDILPHEQAYWSYIKRSVAAICGMYGYQRIDTPIFEDSGLFARGIGEETDIVRKEMYSLEDRGGAKLTLRPEGTASVCRAYIEHGMSALPQPVRLYYVAAIFRYERPQAGRYRQHHQFGVEALGSTDPALDAEVIDMAWRLYHDLGLRGLALHLNSIGCGGCRPQYLESLKAYYAGHKSSLCGDCGRRLSTNPLRLLDCKKDSCMHLAQQSPRTVDFLCQECARHFDDVKSFLDILGLPATLDHRLVRGLDYYTRTVFEIGPAGETAAQATIGGGGRYDRLIEQLGGRPTPGVGFATGIERLVLNLKSQEVAIQAEASPKVFVAYLGGDAKKMALGLASQLRVAGIPVVGSVGDRGLKAQLRQANTANARCAVIIGDEEVASQAVILRDMLEGKQETVPADRLVEVLSGSDMLASPRNRSLDGRNRGVVVPQSQQSEDEKVNRV